MTNNKENKDYNLEFEESTKHRDKLKNKEHGAGARILRGLINMLNKSIWAYNNTVARIPRVKKIPELNPDQTAEEMAEGGASSVGLAMVDEVVKGIRRIGIPWLQAGGFFTGAVATGASTALASAEFAVDKIKDLLLSGALSGLATKVGDLKDGQARLGKSVNAQGKKIGDLGDKLDGVGNRVGNLEGEMEGLGVE